MAAEYDPDILQDFLTESSELIEQLDQDLVRLESLEGSERAEVCDACFRALHTIKGAASFLAISAVTTFSHAAEDALNKLRREEVELTSEIMDVLLASADVVRGQIQNLRDGENPAEGPPELVARLIAIAEADATSEPAQESDEVMSSDAAGATGIADGVSPAETTNNVEAASDDSDKLNLSSAQRDMLPLMLQDVRVFADQLDEAAEQFAVEATRASVADCMVQLVEPTAHTVDFLAIPALSAIFQPIRDCASKLADAPESAAPAIAARLKAIGQLLLWQCDVLEHEEVRSFEVQQLSERLKGLCAGEIDGTTFSSNGDVSAVLKEDGIIVDDHEDASTTASVEPVAPSGDADSSGDSTTRVERRSTDRRRRDRRQTVMDQTVRVEVGRLESLLNLVGQLVLNKNRLMAISRAAQHNPPHFEADERGEGNGVGAEVAEHLNAAASELDRLTSELQVGVMRTRMQPLGKLFDRYPRVIRDMARTTNKQIGLEIEGRDTEVDKSVLEALSDPLVHLLRNAADHGIESPEDRVANGKSEQGTIRLTAEHQGSHVRVAITDDGKGIDRDIIGNKAIEKGMATAEQVAAMPDSEVFRFIFGAGFSTAAKVSDLSGRGVGMDVVRTNVQKINGEITISSEIGKGTTLEIMIPLTLAIMPAMLVGVGAEVYALPLQSVVEIIKPDQESSSTIQGFPVVRLRDRVLPLLNLENALSRTSSINATESAPSVLQADDAESSDGSDLSEHDERGQFAVITAVGSTRVGLCVDRLVGQQEIVIKPLDDEALQAGPFSGATIRDNGRVSLIVDVHRLIRESAPELKTVKLGKPEQCDLTAQSTIEHQTDQADQAA